ncbi:interleukin 33 [Rhinolophus ferrumequinum]|uniref:Interleukin-33 n=1 Tax=Rhinolophus ferrumequinum TaxID=59479 RepID=A0A671F4K2_RHIFE|nr:interleukin-33 [Rhinolophus ferrumequinum]XP_032979771.1 interleukin-33 [Rhinolophus ferrumequinum]XP_032979772.1 interleukin-33 [Rhinolophus ferrumequinum]XP_032979773.1 interleukin-33 [Rhinolophus ferrumequinum]XP_032979774.1 interleukin-33 [Rhinolophus ferrumequinum]XP_032979775.1 interleukin-33 [Rhinolophus ferrumequinum]XP_032979776.1 interleukin-33 [Rhinolophus ferrumequinum]KAF6327452.1 interleukin 33 [Rhinolophus ferrumequinum]
MKHTMKYSTTKISSAKMDISSVRALVKSPRLRKSQQKAGEVCQMCFTQLRSGFIIKKKACFFGKETTNGYSSKTAGKYKESHLVLADCQQHLERSAEGLSFDRSMVQNYMRATGDSSIQERSVSLRTFNDQCITFPFAGDGSYEISVEDSGKKQKKDKVLFRFYDSQISTSETGDGVDGQKLMVNLSPTRDKDFLLLANNKEHSVELQKCEDPLPDQTFFLLHREPSSSKYVSFECKSNPGVFIGVKDNHLALVKLGEQTGDSNRENIIFKLS